MQFFRHLIFRKPFPAAVCLPLRGALPSSQHPAVAGKNPIHVPWGDRTTAGGAMAAYGKLRATSGLTVALMLCMATLSTAAPAAQAVTTPALAGVSATPAHHVDAPTLNILAFGDRCDLQTCSNRRLFLRFEQAVAAAGMRRQACMRSGGCGDVQPPAKRALRSCSACEPTPQLCLRNGDEPPEGIALLNTLLTGACPLPTPPHHPAAPLKALSALTTRWRPTLCGCSSACRSGSRRWLSISPMEVRAAPVQGMHEPCGRRGWRLRGAGVRPVGAPLPSAQQSQRAAMLPTNAARHPSHVHR